MMVVDLFGNEVGAGEVKRVNIYADEIWETEHSRTKERWIYTGAIYELSNNPILSDIASARYLTEKEGWEEYKEKNNVDIHWADLGKSLDKKFIVERWLKFIETDCFASRKFHFSLAAINLSNLNLNEFDRKQSLNSIYNRFFRSMLKYSLKKFFGRGVVIDHVYHEQGSQEAHKLFDWHTIFVLDQDESLNFQCKNVEFLPKSHKEEEKSNNLQLCDVLLGIYRDIHCGAPIGSKNQNRREILNSNIVQELLLQRVLRNPLNTSSSYGYANRFHISFFPRQLSKVGSIERKRNNYYDPTKIELACDANPNQLNLGI